MARSPSMFGSCSRFRWMHMILGTWVTFSLAAGCSRADAPSSAAESATPADTVTPAPDRRTSSGAGSTDPVEAASQRHDRKLVRSAAMTLEVEAYGEARRRIEQSSSEAGGYIAQAEVRHSDGAITHAVLELRLPAHELDSFMRDASALGSLQHETVHSREITDEYYDNEARLRNARELERRLLEFAAMKTPSVKDLLEVERELARVREAIETLQGRQTLYTDQVAFSALSLTLQSVERTSRGEPPGLLSRLGFALRDSTHELAEVGSSALVLSARLAPWLPVLALCWYLMRRTLSRRPAPRPGALHS